MSKGLGPLQRRVLDVLYEQAVKEGLPTNELKALVGGDRSNLRRAIRTLTRRRLVEEATVESKRRIRLTFMGKLKAMPSLPDEPDPLAELRAKWKEEDRERALEKERIRLKAAEGQAHHPRKRRRVRRRRRLGHTQERVLAVLAQGIDGEFRALETTYLKSLVGGDRSNLRRAIRTLWEQDYIEERTVAGRCYYELTLFGFMRAVPLDPATAPRLLDL